MMMSFEAASSCCLFLDNLSFSCNEFEIQRLFGQYGLIEAIVVKKERNTKQYQSKYAFITYKCCESAFQAMTELQGAIILGRPVRIDFAADCKGVTISHQQSRSLPVHTQTAQIQFSFFTRQTRNVMNESLLRNVFSRFGEVMEVTIQKTHVREGSGGMKYGYGLIHYPSTVEGIHSCLKALENMHQVTIGSVTFDTAMSTSLRDMIESDVDLRRTFQGLRRKTDCQPSPPRPESDKKIAVVSEAEMRNDDNDFSEGCGIMLSIPMPMNENKRLQILKEARIFDTNPFEESYDRYTAMASRLFQVPIAAISLIDVDRQWFKSRVGLKAEETPRTMAFCTYAILEATPSVLIVPDALQDPRFAQNPLVLGPPFIRFYAGASLMVDEVKLGTLCIIDTVPRSLDQFKQREIAILQDLACIVSNLIKQRREDHLKNIYETLLMNADMMKLLQGPLLHLMQWKGKIQSLYSSMRSDYCRGSLQQSQTHSQRMIVKQLFEEVHYFTMKTHRFIEISSYLTQLVTEIHHLEKTESISNYHQRKLHDEKKTNQEKEKEVEEAGPVVFQSFTKMNVRKLQKDIRKYYSEIRKNEMKQKNHLHIDWKLDQVLEQKKNVPCKADPDHIVTVPTTLSKDENCPIPQFLYSYPILLQLILMILIDYFDHHSYYQFPQSEKQLVVITIESIKNNTHNDQKEHCVTTSGYWLITVVSNISYPQSLNLFIDVFRILTRIRNCRHYLSPNKRDVKNNTNTIYSIEIPFYDFQYTMATNVITVDKTAKTAISCIHDDNNHLSIPKEKKKQCQFSFRFLYQQVNRIIAKQHLKILPLSSSSNMN